MQHVSFSIFISTKYNYPMHVRFLVEFFITFQVLVWQKLFFFLLRVITNNINKTKCKTLPVTETVLKSI